MSQGPDWQRDPNSGELFYWFQHQDGQYYRHFQSANPSQHYPAPPPAQPTVNEHVYGTQTVLYGRDPSAAQPGVHPYRAGQNAACDSAQIDTEATPRAMSYMMANFGRMGLQNDQQGATAEPLVRRRLADEHGTTMIYSTGPAEKITDPNLFNKNIHATKRLFGTEGDVEPLDKSYKKRLDAKRYFQPGKVFGILWSQNAGNLDATNLTEVTRNQYNEEVHTKPRRFVVIRAGPTYCTALPIATYGGKGVAKRGVVEKDHLIVHTTKHSPGPMDSELVGGEEGMPIHVSVRVIPDREGWKLDEKSRLNFAKLFTIEHNLKVKSFGKVLDVGAMTQHWFNIWMAPALPAGMSATASHAESSQHAASRRRGQHRRSTNESTNYDAPGSAAQHVLRMQQYMAAQNAHRQSNDAMGGDDDSNDEAVNGEGGGDDDDDDDDGNDGRVRYMRHIPQFSHD